MARRSQVLLKRPFATRNSDVANLSEFGARREWLVLQAGKSARRRRAMCKCPATAKSAPDRRFPWRTDRTRIRSFSSGLRFRPLANRRFALRSAEGRRGPTLKNCTTEIWRPARICPPFWRRHCAITAHWCAITKAVEDSSDVRDRRSVAIRQRRQQTAAYAPWLKPNAAPCKTARAIPANVSNRDRQSNLEAMVKLNLLAGVTLATLSASSATAADIPAKAPVYKAPVIAAYSWTGFYAGLNGGYSWGQSRASVDYFDVMRRSNRRPALPPTPTTSSTAEFSAARSAPTGRAAYGSAASKRISNGPARRAATNCSAPPSRRERPVSACPA